MSNKPPPFEVGLISWPVAKAIKDSTWRDSQKAMTLESFKSWMAPELTQLYGDRIICAVLTGSRAKGNFDPDSDWDVLVVLRDAKPTSKTGPLVKYRYCAPDGNVMDVHESDPDEWENPESRFVVECKASYFRLI